MPKDMGVTRPCLDRTVSGNMDVKSEVCSFNNFEAIDTKHPLGTQAQTEIHFLHLAEIIRNKTSVK